ncbi:hypothetical protein [Acinetobacter calcoaceticus]|uniref:hypothetical protein n=1 Tax=Acinetobacter calcoaceticus TaxID=471 RepID=UPI001D0E3FC5|nr:hypothetical protein [Acinetobacter calcoaceticus]
MAHLFILFLVSIITTIILLIKPSWTALQGKPALTRGKISIYGISASIISILLIGIFAPPVEQENKKNAQKPIEKTSEPTVKKLQPTVEKTQLEIEQEAEDFREKIAAQHQELANADRPHFEWPKVDYTKAVAKVGLHDDKAIVKAVGKKVADQEDATNQNGEPMQSYYFSKDLTNYLQLDLSREYIDIAWAFDAKDPVKATAVFEDGQRITRALLGGQAGSALYENIAKGGKIDELHLEDGTVIKNARCGQSMCRYQIER